MVTDVDAQVQLHANSLYIMVDLVANVAKRAGEYNIRLNLNQSNQN